MYGFQHFEPTLQYQMLFKTLEARPPLLLLKIWRNSLALLKSERFCNFSDNIFQKNQKVYLKILAEPTLKGDLLHEEEGPLP